MKAPLKSIAALAPLVAALLLAACSPGDAGLPFREYLLRLGRTLDAQPGEITDPVYPRPPRPGQLQWRLPGSKLDTLDFLALSGCEVQVTIGKRNSSLGRTAAPSQRLLLELEFLRLAPGCIAWQRRQGEGALAGVLQEAWELKREQLPRLIFNATLGAIEYRDFWSPATMDSGYPDNTGSGVITALESVNGHARRWLAGSYTADNLEFELLLGEIAGGDGGLLLRAMVHQQAWLERANNMLRQNREHRPLCKPGYRSEAADILPNVVQRYFVGAIQPRSAALGRRYHQLLPPVKSLESLLEEALPDSYREWRELRDERLQQAAAAPRRHVEEIQQTLEACAGEGGRGQK